MDPTQQKFVDEALRLPAEARTALASQLLESLEGEVDVGAEDAWAEEIAKRLTEIDSAAVELVPWSEARRRIVVATDSGADG